MPKPHEEPPVRLSPAMRHFLEQGCWAAAAEEEKLELYLFSAQVFRGNLEPLKLLWQQHGATVKAAHRGETFTEAMLAGTIPRRDADNPTIVTWEPFSRLDCEEHPPTSSAPAHPER